MNTKATSVQHNNQQRTNPSICSLQSSHYVDELTPVLDTELHYAARARNLPAQIAREQLRQLDELSLIGYPTSFDEQTRDVVYETLRLAAERVLDA